MTKRLCDLTPEQQLQYRRTAHAYYVLHRRKNIARARAAQRHRWQADPDAERTRYRDAYVRRKNRPLGNTLARIVIVVRPK